MPRAPLTAAQGRPEPTGVRMRGTAKGFSLIELLIVVAIILIIAAIAIPNLIKSRIAANESATVGNLKTMTNSLATYVTLYPECGFPDSLTRLGPGSPPTNAAAGMLDAVMAQDAFIKSGYNFTYALVGGTGDCAGTPGTDYEIEAQPAVQNKTGVRGFWVDSSHLIRGDPDGDAGSSSPAL